jgi:NADH-quinone oxidoreductase subunit M
MEILSTIILFLPMVGFSVLLFLNGDTQKNAIKWTAFGFSVVTFLMTLVLWAGFDASNPALQFVHRWNWLDIQVGDFSIVSDYYVGVDGLSLLLIVLTGIIMPVAILGSFRSNIFEERGREKLYYALLLLLEWAMLGVFFIQDLIVFYIFWEVTLVPMYFLIGIWGAEERVYAAVKFFLYTMAGSILMLIAILFVGNAAGTFILPEIVEMVNANPNFWNEISGPASASTVTGGLLFFGFFIAFAIKVPIFPFHSWLPDAHVQAPTAGSVILAGVLLKLGTYGLVRFNLQMFPLESVQAAPLIAALGVIGILYGAWVSYAQTNVKKLVAYSSISHLGFVVLGIFALNSQGIQGATLQMVNHGISTGGLFLMVGILYERYHTKEMSAYGGIWKVMPLFGGLSLIIALSSMGLPGLNGFIGEFTILLGSLGSNVLGFFYTLLGTVGVILAAVYILKMYQHVYMGEFKAPPAHDGHGEHGDDHHGLKLHWTELAALAPLLIAIFWIGLQPGGFFDAMGATTVDLAEDVEEARIYYVDSLEDAEAEELASPAEEDAAEEADEEEVAADEEAAGEEAADSDAETTEENSGE